MVRMLFDLKPVANKSYASPLRAIQRSQPRDIIQDIDDLEQPLICRQ